MSGAALILARRALLGAATLWLLSLVVFAACQVLPGDVGRAMLGPLADPAAVAAIDRQLGADRPLALQYGLWLLHVARLDLGTSFAYRAPVAPFIAAALGKSLALAGMVFVLAVPASLAAGIYAAYRAGKWQDRAISLAGLALTVVPEFVSSIILILVFGVWLRALPVTAEAPPGAGLALRAAHLILPALPLVLVLFGYIARMAREGTLDVLRSAYIRTAVLKGLPPAAILFRHVLRNALLPAIAVIATQTGYMVGGLVVVETLFRYPGIGSLILSAARAHDVPMLQAAILAVGALFVTASLLADALILLLDPRRRAGQG